MGLSVWQIVLVVVLFLLLFGRGKIPALMGDLAAGIKSFKSGIKEDQVETPSKVEPQITATELHQTKPKSTVVKQHD